MDGRKGSRGADMLLLLTAAIWGFAFVAQRAGMRHIGPFWFNSVRFAMGCLFLLPVAIWRGRGREKGVPGPGGFLLPGIIAGSVLFAGASLQQAGLVYTSAGNAGFVTGLYVLFVPVLGLFRRRSTPAGTWIGALLATGGMYLLSSSGTTRMAFGDLLVLAGAVFWAIHIQVVSQFAGRTGALRLAATQFAVCSLLSLVLALIFEEAVPADLVKAGIPLLYGGFVSVGIAYTLQVVAQRRAHPSHAAVIMSMEALFAGLGGWLVLGESLGTTGLMGCALMFSAIMISVISSGSRQTVEGVRRPPVLYNQTRD